MNKITFLLLLFIPALVFGQNDYVLEKKETLKIKKRDKVGVLSHKFSVELFFNLGVEENKSVPSGFVDSLNKHVNVNINGGNAIGAACTYQLNNKIDIELGYNYVASGMEAGYFKNGYGCFERNIITPIISYSPLSYKNITLKFKGGINYAFTNKIIVDFDLPIGKTKIVYDYGKSTGFLLASELKFRTNKKLSPKAGVLYTWNNYDLTNGAVNGQKINPVQIPVNTQNFKSSSVYVYFSLAFNFSIDEK